MTKPILIIFLHSVSQGFSLHSFSGQPSPAPYHFHLESRTVTLELLLSLRSSHNPPCILQCVMHILFLLSPTFFFFQKACGSLSFNYGVLKDSSAAFMLVNFILPLIAPYSPDFLIPQNLLS